MGEARWQGDLHKFYTGDECIRRLSRYGIVGLPKEVAHVRQDEPRGPWVMHLLGEDVGTEKYKTDAQRAILEVLGL
jgi:hypothetical protein